MSAKPSFHLEAFEIGQAIMTAQIVPTNLPSVDKPRNAITNSTCQNPSEQFSESPLASAPTRAVLFNPSPQAGRPARQFSGCRTIHLSKCATTQLGRRESAGLEGSLAGGF